MTIVKEVTVEGIRYPVTVSDDNEALLAAAAAGRAIIGIWDPSVRPLGAGFDACLYLVCEMEAADDILLEKAVRRQYGLPWIITQTERLLIREFTKDDPMEAESADDGDVYSLTVPGERIILTISTGSMNAGFGPWF